MLGYLKVGSNLPTMMRSTAKLVNDTLETRLTPFRRTRTGHEYFDGCRRDAIQARRAYRYTLLQAQRHSIVDDYRSYPHTRVNVELERAIAPSHELNAFLEGIPYKRYDDGDLASGLQHAGNRRMRRRRGNAGRGVGDVRMRRPAC